MGLTRKKRNRLESVGKLPDAVGASLGSHNLKWEKFDDQLIHDQVNAKLDIRQAKINAK